MAFHETSSKLPHCRLWATLGTVICRLYRAGAMGCVCFIIRGYWIKLLELGRLNGLEGLIALVSIGVVQVIGCTVRVSGWDMACKGRWVSGEG